MSELAPGNPRSPKPGTVDFGYREVPAEEKSRHVRAVFDSVAGKYDLMNDLMSVGLHRLWKRFAVNATGLRPGARVLDLAGGTGDLARLFADRVGPGGEVVLTDINHAMLAVGRDRMIDAGRPLPAVQCDAEKLPFPAGHFDGVSIAFGLRNVTNKPAALASMRRVLRPGGRLLVLEFSKPVVPGLKPIYDIYSFSVLPWLGKRVAGDSDSYQYLAESIRKFPDQETLKGLMQDAGLEDCSYHNLSGGIVAMHKGFRY